MPFLLRPLNHYSHFLNQFKSSAILNLQLDTFKFIGVNGCVCVCVYFMDKTEDSMLMLNRHQMKILFSMEKHESHANIEK